MAAITEKTLAGMAPGTIIYDDKLKGFCARRQTGEAIMFGVRYRLAGRSRWLTLGRWQSPLSVADARRAALGALSAVAEGKDPGEPVAAPATLGEAAERWLSEHMAEKRKASTAKEARRLIERHVLPRLGMKPLAGVTKGDMAAMHHGMRKTPTEANRTLATMKALWNWCEAVGLLPDGAANPCRKIERNPEKRRERFLSADEMARLGEALAGHAVAMHIAAIRLLIFTGARLGEILNLRWDEVDMEKREARLLDHKTDRHGGKTIHLGGPALTVLAELPRVDGVPFVLGGNERKPGEPHATSWIEIPWRVIRHAAGLDDVRIHDLRHAFASVAASSGLGLPIIGKMLGHTQQATTQRYAHLASDPVKAAAEATASKIAGMMSTSKGGQVVPLRRGA